MKKPIKESTTNEAMQFKDVERKPHECSDLSKVTFRPSTYVCVLHEGKLLMIVDERSGKWELPGGGLEIGEELHEGAAREVLEETGYKVKVEKEPFHIQKEMFYFRRRDNYHHALCIFLVAKLENEVQGEQNFAENEKILKVKFHDINKLDELDIIEYQQEAIKKFLEMK